MRINTLFEKSFMDIVPETMDKPRRKGKNHAFWTGFIDALFGPKSRISGLRRRFFTRSWQTRLSFVLIAAAILSGFATYAALTESPPFGDSPNTVIWLLNLDLVLLLMLGILVARRIVAIWSGRRQNIAGSRLHVRLVVIFSIMAALPAVIMAVFSAFFFHFGVQSWFNDNVRTAVYDSQVVAEAYLQEHQQVIRADILAMANDIDRQAALMMDANAAYNRVLDSQSLLRNLSEAVIFDDRGKILARSGLTFSLTLEKVPDYLLDRAREGEVIVLTDEADDRVRALVQLNSGRSNFLFVGRQVDPSVLSFLASAKDATERYRQLESSYSGLQITVTMIFVVVALLLLLAAIWVGIVLARQLVGPISTLISASERVRAGDLEARVPRQEQIEEFDYLATSFNRMTSQIRQQRDELLSTNRQLDERRRLTETVLAGVPAGVVGIGRDSRITFANNMALSMFASEDNGLVGAEILDIFPDLEESLQKAYDKPQKIHRTELLFTPEGKSKLILNVRIAIEQIGDVEYGAVITFDDITELQSAQRKAAWADVARRIAHEIKNPLTPIQLSAERLKKKYMGQIREEDRETFEVCTDTIIRHVGDIGRMVNEFSDFARMPEAVLTPNDLTKALREIVVFQNSAHPAIDIRLINDLPKQKRTLMCDMPQVRQALMNLLQNAADSIEAKKAQDAELKGIIHLVLGQADDQVAILIGDNGMGLPDNAEQTDLTEPYVTFKSKGTGLGLAIVKKIMSDHGGKLLLGADETSKSLKGWQDLGGATIGLFFPASLIVDEASAAPEKKRA
jgi:two-component system nitrogen regulation sensor histidine kinase NtrY